MTEELSGSIDSPGEGAAERDQERENDRGEKDHRDDEVFTALWGATYEDEAGVAAAHWLYVVSFEEVILHRSGPFHIREDEVADYTERADRAVAWARQAAASLGYES